MKKHRLRMKLQSPVPQIILNIVGVLSAIAVVFILIATLARW